MARSRLDPQPGWNLNSSDIERSQLAEFFLSEFPLIDVRAPVEFAQGHLPGAVNLPLLNDEERAQVGTAYKQQNREAAIELGHRLISGEVKSQRIQAWMKFLEKNPSAVIYCFRGGMRSQISRQWIQQAGLPRPLIKGGYKGARNFLIQSLTELSQSSSLLAVTGPTGSGKTRLLTAAKSSYPILDLEALAHHRGSAFGGYQTPQPSQVNFENQMAVELLKLKARTQQPLLVEDESRMIGRITLPGPFFTRMRESEVIWIEEDLESRVENIFEDYILSTDIGAPARPEAEDPSLPGLAVFALYRKSLAAISKKLGGLRSAEIFSLLVEAEEDFQSRRGLEKNREWIRKLLIYYYDPLYLASLQRRQVKCRFRGSREDCLGFLKSL